MNERMEQEINRTIALLQASMPQRKSEAALSQLLNIAKSEMNPLCCWPCFSFRFYAACVCQRTSLLQW